MPQPIGDYALIGDLHTAALVGRSGSIDWLCLPRFDSEACFATLLGDERFGHWQVAPAGEVTRARRRYLPGTLVLETEFSTASGAVRVIDCMPPRVTDCLPLRAADPVIVRLVEGTRGRVDMHMTLAPRFEYGSAVPVAQCRSGAQQLAAGGEALWLFSPLSMQRARGSVAADFSVGRGQVVPMALVWRPSAEVAPPAPHARDLVEQTTCWWQDWVAGLSTAREWRDAVVRSLITVRALTHATTGGMVAAPTTSLPQQPSGTRNWDYRYCWIRDAAEAFEAFSSAGALADAAGIANWLANAAGSSADQAQAVYGLAGERRLPEIELDWLPGYEGARPVRIGNSSSRHPQLGTFGDLMRTRLAAAAAAIRSSDAAWDLDAVLEFLESRWRDPDAGIWEIRGPPRQFVHTKVMIWAAADAAVKLAKWSGDGGGADRWRRLRADVHADVLEKGYDPLRNTFVQCYGSAAVDISLLRLPLLGFLPAAEPRMTGTVNAVLRDLDDSGVLLRYRQDSPPGGDGLPPGEGGYLPGSFWLVRCLALMGRRQQARRVFGRLLDLRNDVGLLGEEYDPLRRQFAGNFPLAGSHLGLIAAARELSGRLPGHPRKPARDQAVKAQFALSG